MKNSSNPNQHEKTNQKNHQTSNPELHQTTPRSKKQQIIRHQQHQICRQQTQIHHQLTINSTESTWSKPSMSHGQLNSTKTTTNLHLNQTQKNPVFSNKNDHPNHRSPPTSTKPKITQPSSTKTTTPSTDLHPDQTQKNPALSNQTQPSPSPSPTKPIIQDLWITDLHPNHSTPITDLHLHYQPPHRKLEKPKD